MNALAWTDEDEANLAATHSAEKRLWRKAKELYGIDAPDLLPRRLTVDSTFPRQLHVLH
jgi:hypothetical protein